MRAQNGQFVLLTPSILGAPLFYESGCCPLAPLGLIFRVLFISSEFLGAVPLACCLRVRVLFGVFLGFYFWLKFFLSCVGACPKHNSFYFSFLRAGFMQGLPFFFFFLWRAVFCRFFFLVCGLQLLSCFLWEDSSIFYFHFIFYFLFIFICILFYFIFFCSLVYGT